MQVSIFHLSKMHLADNLYPKTSSSSQKLQLLGLQWVGLRTTTFSSEIIVRHTGPIYELLGGDVSTGTKNSCAKISRKTKNAF